MAWTANKLSPNVCIKHVSKKNECLQTEYNEIYNVKEQIFLFSFASFPLTCPCITYVSSQLMHGTRYLDSVQLLLGSGGCHHRPASENDEVIETAQCRYSFTCSERLCATGCQHTAKYFWCLCACFLTKCCLCSCQPRVTGGPWCVYMVGANPVQAAAEAAGGPPALAEGLFLPGWCL